MHKPSRHPATEPGLAPFRTKDLIGHVLCVVFLPFGFATLTSMPVLSAPLADTIALGELGGEDPRILRGVDLPEIDEADCALTVTRSRCSTFRHGP